MAGRNSGVVDEPLAVPELEDGRAQQYLMSLIFAQGRAKYVPVSLIAVLTLSR